MSISPYANKPWLKHYPDSILENIPHYSYTSLGDCISKTSAQYNHSIAFTTCLPSGFNASLTFAQVEELSNNFAAYFLNELGLKKGDRVALQIPNCPGLIQSQKAVFKNKAFLNLSYLF